MSQDLVPGSSSIFFELCLPGRSIGSVAGHKTLHFHAENLPQSRYGNVVLPDGTGA